MKNLIRNIMAATIYTWLASGCLATSPQAMQNNSVMVNELVSVCGALVGGQAEQRINQEWAKHPGAQANRAVVESVADVLLNNPQVPEQQRIGQYKKYITCATGMFLKNGILQ